LHNNAKYMKGRLGTSAKGQVEQVTDNVYAANFVLGGRAQKKGVIDTATDFVAVESSECTSCTGLGYTPGDTTTVSNTTQTIDYGAY
jgi:hypothetical protein